MCPHKTQVAASLCFFVLIWVQFAKPQDASAPSPEYPQSNRTAPQVPSASSSAPAVFPLSQTGTWDLSVWAREAIGNSANGTIGDAFVSLAGFRAGYVFAGPAGRGPLRGTLEYFFEVVPVFVLTKPRVIYGGGISPVGLKWNSVNSRRKPCLEMSLGGILNTHDVPPGNTSNLNFTVSAGAGAAIFTRPRHALTAGVSFWHLSNAHLGRNNPSLNALEIGVEYHWFRAK